MATIKQMKMLSARAKEAGIDWVHEDGAKLSNDEVDQKLAEFGAKPEDKDVLKKEIVINAQRFGLACKVVLSKYPHFDEINAEKFAEQVHTVYDLMRFAESSY